MADSPIISVRFPAPVQAKLQALAKSRKVSVSTLIRDSVAAALGSPARPAPRPAVKSSAATGQEGERRRPDISKLSLVKSALVVGNRSKRPPPRPSG
jgi:hypothetical protein